MNCIMGIDIGGTEIKIGKFVDGHLIDKFTIKTDITSDGKNIIKDIFRAIDGNINDDNLVGVGIGVPGPVVNGLVLGAQNLGWQELDVKQIFHEKYKNIEIAVLNDANAATYGEMASGSAKGYQSLVMLTLGTGLGGGIVIGGHLVEGATGSAGEVGHIKVADTKPRKCTCGLNGCLEQYASATGILKTAYLRRENKSTLLNKDNLTCKEVFDFAKAGDEIAIEVVDEMTDYLASGCATIADILNPEIIIIGGGLSKAGKYLLDIVEEKFTKLSFYSVKKTKFALAILGNDAGMYGAMHAVRVALNED